MGTAFLNSLSVTSTTDCCTLVLICLAKVFHDGSAKFTTEDFECMVCLKKLTLQYAFEFLKDFEGGGVV